MAIPVFKDYDPAHPFDVKGETHTVTGGFIRLDHTPLQGSVTIEGFTENTKSVPARGEFYIDYQAENQYVTATQKVLFNSADEGTGVTVNYKGVSTIIFARHFIEIWEAIETLKASLSGISHFNISVVDELPTKDISDDTIYLVNDKSDENNIYTEYLYVNGKWEILGSVAASLVSVPEKPDGTIIVNNETETVVQFATANQIEAMINRLLDAG